MACARDDMYFHRKNESTSKEIDKLQLLKTYLITCEDQKAITMATLKHSLKSEKVLVSDVKNQNDDKDIDMIGMQRVYDKLKNDVESRKLRIHKKYDTSLSLVSHMADFMRTAFTGKVKLKAHFDCTLIEDWISFMLSHNRNLEREAKVDQCNDVSIDNLVKLLKLDRLFFNIEWDAKCSCEMDEESYTTVSKLKPIKYIHGSALSFQTQFNGFVSTVQLLVPCNNSQKPIMACDPELGSYQEIANDYLEIKRTPDFIVRDIVWPLVNEIHKM